MNIAYIRARGQAAQLAGWWLALFVPFFYLGALAVSGYGAAATAAVTARPPTYAPLVAWASGHLALVVIFPLFQVVPLLLIIALPATLRRVVQGEGGRAAQWLGAAGIALLALFAIVDLITLGQAALAFGGADATARGAIGAQYRITAITVSLVANVLCGLLLALWLLLINFPLARVGGRETIVGFVGVAGAAFFGAAALLVAFNPQQPISGLVGTAQGWLGVWLILVGTLLVRRAPLLGDDRPEPEPAPEHADDVVDAGG